jgi:hypothetical protein
MHTFARPLSIALIAAATLGAAPAAAQKKYGPGASDTEIKVGHMAPYSGPASPYGLIGKTIDAYFRKVNAEGGINGRKVNFISYDDAYSPPKAVEHARKLIESDEVLFIFQSLGTPTNTAIQRYMNGRKVPQLFVASGASKWVDPKNFPWTMGWQPTYESEGRIYGKFLLAQHPDGKVGVLYQNDDYGKDYLNGLKAGLGDKAKSMIVAEVPYDCGGHERGLPDGPPQGVRGQRVLQRDDSKVRRTGDQEGRRDRLAADPPPEQRLAVGRLGAAASWSRERKGHLFELLPEGRQ